VLIGKLAINKTFLTCIKTSFLIPIKKLHWKVLDVTLVRLTKPSEGSADDAIVLDSPVPRWSRSSLRTVLFPKLAVCSMLLTTVLRTE